MSTYSNRVVGLFRLMVVALAGLALASSAHAQGVVSKHHVRMNEDGNCLQDFMANGYRPFGIQSYVHQGEIRYRLDFVPNDGRGWDMRHILSPADFNQKDSDLTSLGYARVSTSAFTLNGNTYYCALWVR